MTRKDSIVLARALANSRPLTDNAIVNISAAEMATWRQCVRAIAGELADDNPRFRRGDFYNACGYIEQ